MTPERNRPRQIEFPKTGANRLNLLEKFTELSKTRRYLESRSALLNPNELSPLAPEIQASVVIPIYGEEVGDVLSLLNLLATQEGIDLSTVEAVCLINSPNKPRTLEDFSGNETDFIRHTQTYDTALKLNDEVYRVVSSLRTDQVDPSLSPEDQQIIETLRASQLKIRAYSTDHFRLPNEMATLGGARDLGIAYVAQRIVGDKLTAKSLQRLSNHIIIQTDLDCDLPPHFVANHLKPYTQQSSEETPAARKIHAVLGEVDISSDDPNVRIIGLQARLMKRRRFRGFNGIGSNPHLQAQNAATGCNLSYRVQSAISVGGVPHVLSLDDFHTVKNLEQLHGTFLSKEICVFTSPRDSARAVGGYGSEKLDYLRQSRFEAEDGEYNVILHAVLAAHILDRVTEWYAIAGGHSQLPVTQLLNELNFDIGEFDLDQVFAGSVGIQGTATKLSAALAESASPNDFQQTEIYKKLRSAMWTRSIMPQPFSVFLKQLEISLRIIDTTSSNETDNLSLADAVVGLNKEIFSAEYPARIDQQMCTDYFAKLNAIIS